jgi:murein DD-endopeptidase MepM/ murein hydrolase activator NlpD
LAWAFGSIFAERRVYIRTAGKTRYLSIPRSSQIGGALAVAALLGWTGFSTASFVSNSMDGHTARIQLETMSEAYEVQLAAYSTKQRGLEEQLSQANQRRDVVTARLSDKQARLVETANSLQEAKAEVAVLRNKLEALIVSRREDAAQVEMLDLELSRLRLAFSDTETSKANLDGALQSLSSAMDKVIAERDLAAGEVNRLDGEVVRLTNSMVQLEDRQERLVSQLEVAARSSLDGLSTMFGRSKIDLDRILTQARRDYTGSGGPLEPLISDAEDPGADTTAGDTRVAALMDNLETVNLMRFAADRLPFGEPVFGGRRTSGFGPRRGRYHNGLDIAAPRGTAIYSTAEGVVTYSGRQRGYRRHGQHGPEHRHPSALRDPDRQETCQSNQIHRGHPGCSLSQKSTSPRLAAMRPRAQHRPRPPQNPAQAMIHPARRFFRPNRNRRPRFFPAT